MALSDDIARCADWLPGTIAAGLKSAAVQERRQAREKDGELPAARAGRVAAREARRGLPRLHPRGDGEAIQGGFHDLLYAVPAKGLACQARRRHPRRRHHGPGYDNILSFMNAATDALLFTQTFCNLAEEEGLGTCFLGTTIYMPKMIIDTLKLPKLVMPVATITLGWPDEHPAKSDRLPLRSIIHQESYSDYTPEKIDDFYAEKESLEENKEFVRINNVETLAQVFTDIRYTKKDCEAMSIGFMDALKQQGFVK